jgi:hypothetical protein
MLNFPSPKKEKFWEKHFSKILASLLKIIYILYPLSIYSLHGWDCQVLGNKNKQVSDTKHKSNIVVESKTSVLPITRDET